MRCDWSERGAKKNKKEGESVSERENGFGPPTQLRGRGMQIRAVVHVAQPLHVRPAVTVLAARLAAFPAAASSTPSRAATHGGAHVVLGDFCERKVVDAVVTGARQHTNAEMNE